MKWFVPVTIEVLAPNAAEAKVIVTNLLSGVVSDVDVPRETTCDWEGHAAAMDEAGWCPACDEGSLDPEWAKRNGVEE